ncbi:hypothetical protein E4U17_003027 [Claviceps sp. LM77 group G4]|nr:hypothetical protein E4U17_003027 [Claviceps sp. LM77 group G4]KAG6079089.1 hypothetical protein E4U16_001262 [Claviceps sp. LM84 group G4]KAG6084471.1 hypothetical protein E4U33_003345 [Claviceps sp. LM78 group G4]
MFYRDGAKAENAANVLAVPTSYCSVDKEVCFQWAVPEAAASSGTGNIYFQLRAPTSYAWIAVAIGSQMVGSDMFVVYDNGHGNVTLSTRPGLKHGMPEYKAHPGVTLLAGSGIVNGQMVANVRCSSCSTLSMKSTNSWSSAWKKGASLASMDQAARIPYHDGHDSFSVDFSKAAVSSDSNPFVGNVAAAVSGSGVSQEDSSSDNKGLLYAHGIIMSLVFLIGFPVGSMLMPLLGKWLVHASWQIVAFILMWVGFGVGYVLSRRWDMFFTQAHTRLGLILCILISFQPVLGWLHHQYYVQHQRRGAISHAHVWFGRILIILGMINGGLGLQLAGNDRAFVIAYCVILAVFAASYLASAVLGAARRRSQRVSQRSSDDRIGVAQSK